MERSSIIKWVLLAAAVYLFLTFGKPLLFGEKSGQKQPFTFNDATTADTRAPEQMCSLKGPRFEAELSTRGGSLRHFRLTDPKYRTSPEADSPPIDLVTTSLESRMPLRTDLHFPDGADEQVPYDDVDWKLTASDENSCTFTYATDTTSVTKVIKTTERPFELAVATTITNLGSEAKKHRFTIEQSSWRTKRETDGPGFVDSIFQHSNSHESLRRQSEFLTKTELLTTQKTVRHTPSDFDPGEFKKKEFTPEQWRRGPGEGRWAAVSSSYFASTMVHVEAPAPPFAEDQIEEHYDPRFAKKTEDPAFGYVYRARLAYPEEVLQPKQSITYKTLAFMGPKERTVLAHVGGGGYDASELLDLGWFSVIGKALVQYVYVLYRLTGSWGWAICLLTISVKMLLFPLSLAQIRSSIGMRKLKPEMDAINAKYKDDATQKGVALQELWRKNKVANPVTGCVPVVLQMPVWFALYTALQTAVELYHTPFGPFIPDLSAAGRYFIIPLVLGASSLIQQRIMPPQGDPQQQKMMMYLMPGVFTVMMLFLPAGLGVYMLTNTWLGITQQVLVERYQKRRGGPGSGIEVREKTSGDDKAMRSLPALGKGKARARG
jgi:YidC/Oxa1 family membrane protein insertase